LPSACPCGVCVLCDSCPAPPLPLVLSGQRGGLAVPALCVACNAPPACLGYFARPTGGGGAGVQAGLAVASFRIKIERF
jgi:hypothetical protein